MCRLLSLDQLWNNINGDVLLNVMQCSCTTGEMLPVLCIVGKLSRLFFLLC